MTTFFISPPPRSPFMRNSSLFPFPRDTYSVWNNGQPENHKGEHHQQSLYWLSTTDRDPVLPNRCTLLIIFGSGSIYFPTLLFLLPFILISLPSSRSSHPVWVATSFTQWFEHSYATCRHSRQPPNSIPAIRANLHSLPRVSSVCTGWSCLGMEWAAKIRLRATRVVAESPVDHIVMYYWLWRATRIRGKGWGVLLRAALIGATLGLLGIIVRQKIEVCCLPRTNTGYHGSPFQRAIHSPGIFLADLWVRAQPVSSCFFIEASLRGFSAAICSLLGSI